MSYKCLDSGKHVYSEKPLGMSGEEAEKLVSLANQRGVYLASAPCSLLSETAQTVWKAIREGVVGTISARLCQFR